LRLSGAWVCRMATLQLSPPLFSQFAPSLKQISSCGALSGTVAKVRVKVLVPTRVITAFVQSALLVEKW